MVLAERAKRSHHKRAEMLKWGIPHPPKGYNKLSKMGWFVVDPVEVTEVREIFDNHIYFESLAKTAQALNLMGSYQKLTLFTKINFHKILRQNLPSKNIK